MRLMWFAGLFSALIYNSAAVAAPACGQEYTIQANDTLMSIAKEAYGAEEAWKLIYEYYDNAALIGTDGVHLRAGTQIRMPGCVFRKVFDQSVPLGMPPKATPFVKGAPNLEVLVYDRPEYFVSGGQPRLGMMAQIMTDAFRNMDSPVNPVFKFLEDPRSHLEVLMRFRMFRFAGVWSYPDCHDDLTGVEFLVKTKCEYDFSVPLYSAALLTYGPKSLDPLPQSIYDLHNKRICRPEGHDTFDLYQRSLVPGETIRLLQPDTPEECFIMLREGEVDFVMMNRFSAELALKHTKMIDDVTIVPTILNTRSLQVIASPLRNGDFDPMLDEFDIQIERLHTIGQTDEIIAWHLMRHREILR